MGLTASTNLNLGLDSLIPVGVYCPSLVTRSRGTLAWLNRALLSEKPRNKDKGLSTIEASLRERELT